MILHMASLAFIALLLPAPMAECAPLPATCKMDEFQDGSDVCIKCSWCASDPAVPTDDSDDSLGLDRLHRESTCRKYATNCGRSIVTMATLQEPQGNDPTTATVHLLDSSWQSGDKWTALLTATTAAEPPRMWSETAASLPRWVWIVVVVLTCALVVSPVTFVLVRRRRRGEKTVSEDGRGRPEDRLVNDAVTNNHGGSQSSNARAEMTEDDLGGPEIEDDVSTRMINHAVTNNYGGSQSSIAWTTREINERHDGRQDQPLPGVPEVCE